LVTVLAVLVAASLLTIGVFLFDYSTALRRARTADALEMENRGLRQQVASLDELSQELEDLTALKAQILMMLGVDQKLDDGESVSLSETTRDSVTTRLALMGVDHMKAAANLSAYAPRQWPVEGYVSREFFEEEDQTEGHPGLDLVAPDGAPVRAAGRGVVTEASHDDWLGNYVVIDHGFGYSTLYGHNQRLLVTVGQSVERGQVIARLGNTGRSSAPHLHFEIRLDGRSVDPRQYLGPK
jgi:murein DD-endopeptidase MepM/ murein hydrolase activator NlpD